MWKPISGVKKEGGGSIERGVLLEPIPLDTIHLQSYTSFFRSYDSVDNAFPAQQPSRHSDLGEPSETQPSAAPSATQAEGAEIKPLVIHFKATLQGLVIGASLLPSLRAQYKVIKIFYLKIDYA